MTISQPRTFNNALILQGDWEGGLANVALDLKASGKNVTKVVFHAGDWVYKWKKVPTVDFDAKINSFEAWLRDYIDENAVDCIILYNQYRPYNQIGWDIAKELDIECIVLELGLLRPDYCSIYTRDLNHFDYVSGEMGSLNQQRRRTVSEPEAAWPSRYYEHALQNDAVCHLLCLFPIGCQIRPSLQALPRPALAEFSPSPCRQVFEVYCASRGVRSSTVSTGFSPVDGQVSILSCRFKFTQIAKSPSAPILRAWSSLSSLFRKSFLRICARQYKARLQGTPHGPWLQRLPQAHQNIAIIPWWQPHFLFGSYSSAYTSRSCKRLHHHQQLRRHLGAYSRRPHYDNGVGRIRPRGLDV